MNSRDSLRFGVGDLVRLHDRDPIAPPNRGRVARVIEVRNYSHWPYALEIVAHGTRHAARIISRDESLEPATEEDLVYQQACDELGR